MRCAFWHLSIIVSSNIFSHLCYSSSSAVWQLSFLGPFLVDDDHCMLEAPLWPAVSEMCWPSHIAVTVCPCQECWDPCVCLFFSASGTLTETWPFSFARTHAVKKLFAKLLLRLCVCVFRESHRDHAHCFSVSFNSLFSPEVQQDKRLQIDGWMIQKKSYLMLKKANGNQRKTKANWASHSPHSGQAFQTLQYALHTHCKFAKVTNKHADLNLQDLAIFSCNLFL